MFGGVNTPQIMVASGTIASAATVVAQSAINDGLDPTTGWAAGVVAAGVSVFVFMDRRAQNERKEAIEQRRKQDEADHNRIAELEAKLEEEREAHRITIQQMNDRIISILSREEGT